MEVSGLRCRVGLQFGCSGVQGFEGSGFEGLGWEFRLNIPTLSEKNYGESANRAVDTSWVNDRLQSWLTFWNPSDGTYRKPESTKTQCEHLFHLIINVLFHVMLLCWAV